MQLSVKLPFQKRNSISEKESAAQKSNQADKHFQSRFGDREKGHFQIYLFDKA